MQSKLITCDDLILSSSISCRLPFLWVIPTPSHTLSVILVPIKCLITTPRLLCEYRLCINYWRCSIYKQTWVKKHFEALFQVFLELPQGPKRLESWSWIWINSAWLAHGESIRLPFVKATPVWFVTPPSCARLVVFGLYNGHPKSINPCLGSRANATHALCTYLDNAITVDKGFGVLMLYVPKTMGISVEWKARKSWRVEIPEKIAIGACEYGATQRLNST